MRGLLETLGATRIRAARRSRSPLGGRRLRVGADAERGFRVDGLLEIEVEIGATAAQDPSPGRLVREVAGGRFVSPPLDTAVLPFRAVAA